MKIGDPVITPEGRGTIVDELPARWEYIFTQKPKRVRTYIVEYTNGHRHAWIPERLQPDHR